MPPVLADLLAEEAELLRLQAQVEQALTELSGWILEVQGCVDRD